MPPEVGKNQIGGGDIPLDFLIEVAKGNIRGHSLVSIISRNPSLGPPFEDLWGPGGIMVFPTGAESWEIISTDVDDSSAGTGARTVTIESLDANYVAQLTTVTLNGTSAVAISGTHLRPRVALVATAGSSKSNEGTITVRVSGGGAVRNVIMSGFSVSQDGHFTVPAGKMAFGLQAIPFYPKDQDGKVRTITEMFGADTPRVVGAEFPFYQNGLVIPIKASFPLPEKTDITFQANSTVNENVEVNLSFDFLLVDMEIQ